MCQMEKWFMEVAVFWDDEAWAHEQQAILQPEVKLAVNHSLFDVVKYACTPTILCIAFPNFCEECGVIFNGEGCWDGEGIIVGDG